MVGIHRLTASTLTPYWKEMRRLWRQDSIRRRHPDQFEDLKRALILDQVEVWLVWDTDPVDRGEWYGPHYALGIVVTCALDDLLWVQFACGLALKKWTRDMAEALTAHARLHGISRLRIYCRKGWLQELGLLWPSFSEAGAVTFHRDPERMYFDVQQAACA